MKKSGELEDMDHFVGSTSSTIESLTSLKDEYTGVEDKLLAQSIVQTAGLFQTVLENQASSVCFATSRKIKEMFGGAENAVRITGYLVRQGRAKFITVPSNDRIQGFKFSMTGNQKLTVSDKDRRVLQLCWALELLQSRFRTNESKLSKLMLKLIKLVRVAEAEQRRSGLGLLRDAKTLQVIRVAKARQRREVLRLLRDAKTLHDQSAARANKIEHVLTVIADPVGPEELHSFLEVNKAVKVQLQREKERPLVNENLSHLDEDEASFEEELAALEKELRANDGIVDLPSVPNTEVTLSVSGETVSSEQTEDDGELEREFSNLALELA